LIAVRNTLGSTALLINERKKGINIRPAVILMVYDIVCKLNEAGEKADLEAAFPFIKTLPLASVHSENIDLLNKTFENIQIPTRGIVQDVIADQKAGKFIYPPVVIALHNIVRKRDEEADATDLGNAFPYLLSLGPKGMTTGYPATAVTTTTTQPVNGSIPEPVEERARP